MSVDALLIFSGALVAILPFLGIPQRLDTILFLFLGVFIVALGIVVRRGVRKQHPGNEAFTRSPRHDEDFAR